MKIHTKFQNISIQDIKVTENEHQVNTSLNEIKNIVTCANYLSKACYYGRQCKFLHCSLHPKVINNQQTTHNEPNQNNRIHFTKQQQKKLEPQQEQTTNKQSTSRTERTANPINKTRISQRNVTNNHDRHTDTNIFNSNIIKCNKNQKNKRTRRSNKQKTSKILNIIYSNARGIKSKTKSIKEILFETQCAIFAITETNLKDKEKVNINGYTWTGKNRASEGGGIGFLINNKIKTAITKEQQENTNTEIMWIRIQLKRKKTLFIGLFYGKQESRNNNATLDEEFKIVRTTSISIYSK